MGNASTSFLVINDIIMTSMLLLKIIFVLTNFLILSDTLPALREIWILTNYYSTIWRQITPFIASIKSCPEVGHDEYI